MLIKSVLGKRPLWGKDCFFADNASIIGDIVIGDFCSIWFNVKLQLSFLFISYLKNA